MVLVQSLSHVHSFATIQTGAFQASVYPRVCCNSCPLSQWSYNHLLLCCAHVLLPSSFLASGSFPVSHLFPSGGQNIGASASTSALSINVQGWFPLTGLISLLFKGLLRVFSSITVQKYQFFGAQTFYGSTLTSIHNYLKNHSFDYTDFALLVVFYCWTFSIRGILYGTYMMEKYKHIAHEFVW